MVIVKTVRQKETLGKRVKRMGWQPGLIRRNSIAPTDGSLGRRPKVLSSTLQEMVINL